MSPYPHIEVDTAPTLTADAVASLDAVNVALAQGANEDVVIAIAEHLLPQHVLLAVLLLIPLVVVGLIHLGGLDELPC